MGINLPNFFSSKSSEKRLNQFQDLDHIDGLSISTISANLYGNNRDDLVMFYFREGANYASVYTQSKIISENIKWNLGLNRKKIFALIVNTRNANCFTGKQGFEIAVALNKLGIKTTLDVTVFRPASVKIEFVLNVSRHSPNRKNPNHSIVLSPSTKCCPSQYSPHLSLIHI